MFEETQAHDRQGEKKRGGGGAFTETGKIDRERKGTFIQCLKENGAPRLSVTES